MVHPHARVGLSPLLLSAALSCGACINLPDFASSTLIDRPRVLAVIAEPPEANQGTTVTFTSLVAGASDVQVTWMACALFQPFVNNTQFGENLGDRGCPRDRSFELPRLTDNSAVLPGVITQEFFRDDEQLRDALGAFLPESTLDAVRTDVGVAFTVEADFIADGKRLRALKRVLLRDTDTPHSNPPPPRFTFDGRQIAGDAGDPTSFVCRPEEPGELRVDPGQSVELAPSVDGSEEPWLETYNVLDARGVLSQRNERAFYSWYASAGTLDDGTTRAPDRATEWVAPDTPSCVQLWLVVRDDHGGQSACRLDVSVGAEPMCAR